MRRSRRRGARLSARQLAQNVLQNAPVAVVVALLRRVDADTHFEADDLAGCSRCGHYDVARRGIVQVGEAEGFLAGEAQALCILLRTELAR